METYKEILKGPDRPKIGVVLSGGGLRCFASFELFQFFEDDQIPIDLLVGCSGGGICVAMKAMNHSVAEMKEIISKLMTPKLFSVVNYKTLLGTFGFPFIKNNEYSSMVDSKYVREAYNILTKGISFEDLSIRTLLQATDLETGKGIVLDSGDLAMALYASGALIPILPPIKLNNQCLVDGGFSSNLPILEAINKNVDIIIAMDFGEKVANKPTSLMDTYSNLIQRSLQTVTSLQNSLALDLHHYEIIFISVPYDISISLRDFEAFPYIYDKGKEVVASVKNRIIEAIEQFQYSKNPFNDAR